MTGFEWRFPASGKEIETFITKLCTDFPNIATCVLDRGFGDLTSWFDDQQPFSIAKCGCLIGSAALCATKSLSRDELLTLERSVSPIYYNDASYILYAAWKTMAGEAFYPHGDPLFHMIRGVGIHVADECLERYKAEDEDEDERWVSGDDPDPERMAEVAAHLTDLLREGLAAQTAGV